MDELNKIGEINTINDIFEFKLSIKTILIILVLWGILAGIFIVFLFGGVNNTVSYLLNIMETIKTASKKKRELKMEKKEVKKENNENADKTGND
jgi:hypothetical protein